MKTIERLTPKVLDRVWGQEIFLCETPTYLGKKLIYEENKGGGLQYHTEKDEAFHLVEGCGCMDIDDGEGNLIRITMNPGDTVRIPPGAPHRFIASTKCVGYEWSTPHYDDRVRCEEKYGVPVHGDEYGLETTKEPME